MTRKSPHIALVTGSRMPKPDVETPFLVAALSDLQLASEIVPWDSAEFDWSAVPLVLLRTPWDYSQRSTEFLAWAERVSNVTQLLNPFPLVKWNCHKSYMRDLQEHGVRIVPTQWLPKGADVVQDIGPLLLSHMGKVVAKPAIGVGANGSKLDDAQSPDFVAHLETLLSQGDVLLQPYVPSVAVRGEKSLIFFEGSFSHCVRKVPANGDYRVQDRYGGTVQEDAPTLQELAEAEKVIAAMTEIAGPSLYARVDLVEWEDAPALMELEVIEPQLFFKFAPHSAQGLAQSLKDQLTAV
ncbi:MAG: RimK family alpha-L-glutamate ligase [Candidatus Methylacidiphilales bacterium]|nr:hypothetical protein [Candidatus Methylacidiphilales bacterium]